MKIVYNRYIPFKGFIGINLLGILFIREEYKNMNDYRMKVLINHESIHTKQMKELGYIFFYILYLLEFLIRLPLNFFRPTRTYYSISFEREAYQNERNSVYLNERKCYSWIKWLFKKSDVEKKLP